MGKKKTLFDLVDDSAPITIYAYQHSLDAFLNP